MKKYLSIFVLVFVLIVGFGIATKVTFAVAGIPECSDGINNDGLQGADDLDSDCHLDGDVANPASYDSTIWSESGAGNPCPGCNNIVPPSNGGGGGGGSGALHLCEDSKDNDGDGLIDALDPGCHTDFDVNNPASYNHLDNDETNPNVAPAPVPAPQVLGATTARPAVLLKTGGVKKFAYANENKKAVALAMAENNRIIIPKLNVNKPILKLKNINALRFEAMIAPYGSTPDRGGNTILAGHSYNSLNGKFSKSTFFNLDKMEKGDEVKVVWQGKNYTYIVTDKGTVSPTQISIEDPTSNAVLTLYGCGKFDNTVRNYIRAELVPEKLAVR